MVDLNFVSRWHQHSLLFCVLNVQFSTRYCDNVLCRVVTAIRLYLGPCSTMWHKLTILRLNKSFTITAFIPTHAHIYTLKHQFTLILKTLKSILKHFSKVAATCFGTYLRPFSEGSWAVLCAVTKLNSVDVRSLCVCTVCGRMSLLSVCMCVWSCCPGEIWS